MKNEKREGWMCFIVTAILLGICIAMLFFVSGGSYQVILNKKNEDENTRNTLAYLRTQIHAHDVTGGVEIAQDGQTLVLKEFDGDSCFETRLYLWDGMLLEDYAPAGEPLNPMRAEEIGRLSLFEPEWRTNKLLMIRTNLGTIYVHLFSEVGI